MTSRVRARFLPLVPLLAACSAGPSEEERAQLLAVDAVRERNIAAGAAIAVILVTASSWLRARRQPLPRLRWPAVGALVVNEVMSALLVVPAGAAAGMLLGPEPPRPAGMRSYRGLEEVVVVFFFGPFIVLIALLGIWLRGAPRRLAARRRRARFWLGVVHAVVAAVMLGPVLSRDSGDGTDNVVAALLSVAIIALLAVDYRLARSRRAATGWGAP